MSESTQQDNYFDKIGALLPEPLKQAIREGFSHESNLLDNDRTFGAVWDAFDYDVKADYFALAGLDQNTIDTVNQNIAKVYEELNVSGDPRHRFNQDGLDGEGLDDGIPDDDNVVGDINPEETEEEVAARKRKLKQALQEIYEEEEKEKNKKKGRDGDKEKKDAKGQDNDAEKPAFGEFHLDRGTKFGVNDKGNYLKLRPKGPRDPRSRKRTYDEKQLRGILLTAVLDKGMTNLVFYRGSKINKQLATQARTMIMTDPILQKAFKGRNVTVETQLPQDPPPWAGPVRKWMHRRRLKEQENRNYDEMREAMKKGNKAAKQFKGADGRTLADALKEDAVKNKQAHIPPSRFMVGVAKTAGWLQEKANKLFGGGGEQPPGMDRDASAYQQAGSEGEAHDPQQGAGDGATDHGHDHDHHEAGETGDEEREEAAAAAGGANRTGPGAGPRV